MSKRTIDQRIVEAIAAHGELDLHGVVMTLWPGLEEKGRDAAISAVNYARVRVAALVAKGALQRDGGLLRAQEQKERIRP